VPTQPTDDELELIRQSGVALRVGRLSLSAGTGSYRVKSSMARVATALGIDRHQAHVTLTEITTTSHRGHSFRTEVTEVRSVGINADRLSELERLAGSLAATDRRVTVEEISADLDRIESKPLLYRPAVNALWAAIACAAFAFLNNGGPVEMAAVFVGAWLGQLVRRLLLHRGLNQFGVTMVAAALACLTYLGVVSVVHQLGATETRHAAGYISAVLFLIPGFPLVTGGLDLAKLDFSAGVARLSYALVVLTSAALAVWGVSTIAGLSPDPAVPPAFDPVLLTALRLIASFVGVLGFALMFNSPWRMAVAAATVGMVANTVRLLLVDADMPAQAAAACAALLVGVLAAVIAPRMRIPRITVSVPAVVIMVPGAAAYRAIFHLSNGDTTQALAYGVQAGLVVIALCIGLAVARMVSDREWAFER
jgi:uncharacterized membrane protein YjjP (DUF1212 family)